MKKNRIIPTQIPFNADGEDCAFTITSRYGAMCWSNLIGGGHYPMTGVLEICCENNDDKIEMGTDKVIQIGNLIEDRPDKFNNPQTGRVYDTDGISPTLNTCGGGHREPKILVDMPNGGLRPYRIRKLTEREVFRLMDVDDSDIDKIQAEGISKSAQYRLAGNSIVVSCLYHIFKELYITKSKPIQHTLF